MLSLGRFRRVAKEWVAAALGVTALAVAVAVYRHESGPTKYRLTITAGSAKGLRHQIAEHLAVVATRRKITLVLTETSGSLEALEKVNAGVLDLALVQGGLDTSERTLVRQVASLKIEPLHLLVKSEYEPVPGESAGLDFLRGRVVNLGEVGSGTNDLAREVLAFVNLHPAGENTPGEYTPKNLSYGVLVAEPDRARLPDAVFTVSGLPSPVVRHLVTKHDYRVVPLRFGVAFALDALQSHRQGPSPPPPFGADSAFGVDRVHVYNTEIPEFTYSVSPPVPPAPVPTFGTRLLLVAHAAKAPAITQLLEAAYSSGPGGPVLDPALRDLAPEFDWHQGALDYRALNKPLIIGDAIDFLEKGTSLTGGVLGGTFFLWQWYRQRVRRRRELGFESYMLKVTGIERRALQTEMEARLDLKELLHLQVELSRLKIDALQQFAEGAFAGEALITGFITQINDARDHLTRLILHERDNLEDSASRQQRSAESVWSEVVGEVPAGPVAAADGERDVVATGEAFGP